jgi:hypothetical protein
MHLTITLMPNSPSNLWSLAESFVIMMEKSLRKDLPYKAKEISRCSSRPSAEALFLHNPSSLETHTTGPPHSSDQTQTAPFRMSPARGILLNSFCGSGVGGLGSTVGDLRRRLSSLLVSVGARPLSCLGHLTLTSMGVSIVCSYYRGHTIVHAFTSLFAFYQPRVYEQHFGGQHPHQMDQQTVSNVPTKISFSVSNKHENLVEASSHQTCAHIFNV